MDPVGHFALRGALVLLFLAAAAHKLRDFSAFRAALAGYDIVPLAALNVVAGGVVVAESAIGIGLAAGIGAPLPALGAAFLLATYAGAIALNLRRGRRDIDCGCTGPAGRVSLSWGLLVRNAFCALAALALALPVADRGLGWLDGFTVAAAILLSVIAYASVETALANGTSQRAMRAASAAGEMA